MGRPKKVKPFEPRTFRLLKELPELKKGALLKLQETGYYTVYDNQYAKHLADGALLSISYPKDSVEKEPKWFVEVFNATEVWVTAKELQEFKAWKKSRNNG